MSWVNLRTVAATVLAIFAVWSHWYAYESGRSKVSADWAREKAVTQQAYIQEMERRNQKERGLQTQITQLQKDHQDENRAVSARYERIIAGLRKRPEARAPSGVPEGAAADVGCTGAGLARSDGEFLAGFAADAARLQTALNTCLGAYNQVRRQLNGE